MTRMTNALRDAIVENALKKCGYAAARAEYDQGLEDWSESVRLEALGVPEAELEASEKRARAIYDKAPSSLVQSSGSFRRANNLILICAGQKDTVWFSGQDTKLSPYKHTIDAEHPLAIQRESNISEAARLKKWRDDVKAPVRAAVNAVSTVAALLKVWPEAKELIPEHVPEAKSQLPAVQVADLNALIGLPTGDAQ